MLKVLRQELKIQIFVLIRPRGGDFLYSDAEFKVMLQDIYLAKELGADGIVSGILKADGTVDCDRTTALIEAASPLPFTFHRAFDCCRDLNGALEDIIFCGAKRILTSGGKNSVAEGIELLKELNKQAAGRIIILPGGGINSQNIQSIKEKTGCTEFHLSAKKLSKSDMLYHKPSLFMNGSREIPEDSIFISDRDTIAEIKKQL
jgi:copper homeostasis protein